MKILASLLDSATPISTCTATMAVKKGIQGAKGTYAETPKASTFLAQNAINRDAEGIERLDLSTCNEAVVKYCCYSCHTLISCHKTFVVAKTLPFPRSINANGMFH